MWGVRRKRLLTPCLVFSSSKQQIRAGGHTVENAPKRKPEAARRANRVIHARTLFLMLVFGILTFAVLFANLYKWQILRHDELQGMAISQQTRKTTVSASRGTIYDRNGDILAISATAEKIFLSPMEIGKYIEENKDAKSRAFIAEGLGGILGVSAADIETKMDKTWSEYEVIKLKAEQEEADAVRAFLNEHGIKGVYISTNAKRYYPYGTLAAHIIGFVGTDDYGLYGLEALYNEELEGTSGMVVTAKDGSGASLLYQYEQYFEARGGDSLELTIDTTMQYYLEKALEELETKYGTGAGATGIIMDVNNGAVRAMASLPTYDLNDYGTIHDERLSAELSELEGDEYLEKLGALQLRQWRSKAVNDTYEPGSTFKILTLAMALEEGEVSKSDHFNCVGHAYVQGWPDPINCSNRTGHGYQTLTEAAGNSCNPAFMDLGLRVGTERFYQYLKDFGLMEKTGIDMIGETTGIFANEKDFNSQIVSLATYSFGQTFNVTPLALVAAQAACVNGGYLYTPYLVERVLDDEGNVIEQHTPTPIRQVISEQTSATVREILEYVVSDGTGRNGQVAGYRIGGKTGTAEKTGQKDESGNNKVVVSFVCFAPADDPEIIMLLTLDTPSRTTGTYVSGGNMVAPVASAAMAEILPYLGYEAEYDAGDVLFTNANVPNVVGQSRESAALRMSASGFSFTTVGDGPTVTDQTPVGGSVVPSAATIILYLGEEKPDTPCIVPNVLGMTAEQANTALTNAGLIMGVSGMTTSSARSVVAISQSDAEGAQLPAGSVVTVQFSDTSVSD
ncbi:MAG: PASTA domain-containing protein [Oscillospiraceae bacterium]|nr:PASTA domain-containing protein [Oscillospiraceae bacterium]